MLFPQPPGTIDSPNYHLLHDFRHSAGRQQTHPRLCLAHVVVFPLPAQRDEFAPTKWFAAFCRQNSPFLCSRIMGRRNIHRKNKQSPGRRNPGLPHPDGTCSAKTLHHTSVRKHVQTKYFPQPATGSTAHRIYRRIARQTRYRTQTTARTLSGAIDHQPQQGYRRTNPATPTRMGHKQQPEKSDDFTQQPIPNS